MNSSPTIDDMVARYKRRNSWWRQKLRPPNLFLYNPRESFLPATPSPRLFIGGAGGVVPEGFLCVDIVPLPNVHVAADAHAMPFQDGTVEAVECDAVLEHVRDPEQIVGEFRRILRPGGYVHIAVPFNHPYHAYPDDYRRWSLDGLKHLLRDFDIVDAGVRTGPATTLIIFLVEFMSSLAPRRLRGVTFVSVGWIIWPLRYLDKWLLRRPDAHVLANTVFALARKPTT